MKTLFRLVSTIFIFVLVSTIFLSYVEVRSVSYGEVKISSDGKLYGGHIGPNAYQYNDRIYVVYYRNDRNQDQPYPYNDYDSYIRYYDFSTETVSSEYLVGDIVPPAYGDTHGAPALVVDDRGYIHVFYGTHNKRQLYARSEFPEDITSWIDRTESIPIDTSHSQGHKYTYPKPIFVDGTLYLFYRGYGGSSGYGGDYCFIKSYDYGETWTQQKRFIDGGDSGNQVAIYPGPAVYANGEIHVVWYIYVGDVEFYGPNTNMTRHNTYYAVSPDGGHTWMNAGRNHSFTGLIDIRFCDNNGYLVHNSSGERRVYFSEPHGTYYTSKNPFLDVSPSGIPYVSYSTPDTGANVCYWKTGFLGFGGQWETISFPEGTGTIIPFVPDDSGRAYFMSGINTYLWDNNNLTLDYILPRIPPATSPVASPNSVVRGESNEQFNTLMYRRDGGDSLSIYLTNIPVEIHSKLPYFIPIIFIIIFLIAILIIKRLRGI